MHEDLFIKNNIPTDFISIIISITTLITPKFDVNLRIGIVDKISIVSKAGFDDINQLYLIGLTQKIIENQI
jgi:hypothetical protein